MLIRKESNCSQMSYPGLSYPKDQISEIKAKGQFVMVDRNKNQPYLVNGGNINQLLEQNPQLIFVFDVHIAGTRQDIIDALYLSKYTVEDITRIIDSHISIHNVNAPIAQDWIAIFASENNSTNIRPRAPTPQHGERPPNLSYPVTSNYTSAYIQYLRQTIHDALADHTNFEQPPDILPKLFTMYDRMFFGDQIQKIMAQKNVQINFIYNDRLVKKSGYCIKESCRYTINFSIAVLLQTFRNGEEFHISSGIKCYDRLECLMNVFEHELIHFIIQIVHGHVKGDPIYKSHGEFFIQLARAYFGHTSFKHSLNQDGNKVGSRENFKLNDFVTYDSSKRGMTITGKITKLNPKTAQVGEYRVPYPMLRLATSSEISNMASSELRAQDYIEASESMGFPLSEEDRNLFYHLEGMETQLSQRISYQPKLGDIVSFDAKGTVITGRVDKINTKTVRVANWRVAPSHLRLATDAERINFLSKPVVRENTREDFHIGQVVQFTSKRTGQVVTGPITKLNPARATINDYTVPYAMLRVV